MRRDTAAHNTVHDTLHNTVIVGAGVAGCCLAYRLASRGLPVTLLDKGRIGAQGASSVPLALLNPNRGRSARASLFDLASLEATWALVSDLEALGLDHGAHKTGVLRVASNARQAKGWQALAGVSWLLPEALSAVAGGVHAPFGGVLVPQGGWLEPKKFLAALVGASRRRGAKVYEGCELRALSADGGSYTLHSSVGEMRANTVVLATGASLTPSLPLPKLERSAGDVIGLETSLRLPCPVAGAVYTGRKGSRCYVGGNHRAPEHHDPAAPYRLQSAAGWFVPALKEAKLASVWTGVRAKTAGNQPITLELAPGLWFLGCFAGRGFLSAALVTEALAERLSPS